MKSLSPLHQPILRLAIILLVAGGLALFLDLPLAIMMADNPLPKEFSRILQFAEIGGHGTGAAMILVAALTCKRLNWRRGLDRLVALRLIGGAYLGGLIVVVLKLIIPRVRPHSALFDNANTALDTFGRGLLAASDHSRSALMSFPSGHAAVAAGLAVSLCWFYPSGRPAFIALAILASLQRINTSNHYLSDVCVGAALGLIGAFFCMPRGELANHSPDSSGPTPRPG